MTYGINCIGNCDYNRGNEEYNRKALIQIGDEAIGMALDLDQWFPNFFSLGRIFGIKICLRHTEFFVDKKYIQKQKTQQLAVLDS